MPDFLWIPFQFLWVLLPNCRYYMEHMTAALCFFNVVQHRMPFHMIIKENTVQILNIHQILAFLDLQMSNIIRFQL